LGVSGTSFPIEAAERALVSKLHEVGEMENRLLVEAVCITGSIVGKPRKSEQSRENRTF